MSPMLAASASAIWLGVLTSSSPCPLASNVAAISFVGRSVDRPRRVLAAGLTYSLGRAVTYVLVGALVVSSVLSIPNVSVFLQKRMNQVLGPLLFFGALVPPAINSQSRVLLPAVYGLGTGLPVMVLRGNRRHLHVSLVQRRFPETQPNDPGA